MRKLPEPINGAELYLAAILDELRALRVAVEGRGPAAATAAAGLLVDPDDPFQGLKTTSDVKATKRTRARTPR